MLKQRIISAVIAILLLAIAVYSLETPQLRWIVLAIWTLGAWEWSGFVTSFSRNQRFTYSFVVLILLFLISLDFVSEHIRIPVLLLGAGYWIIAFVKIIRFPQVFKNIFILISGLFVLVPSYFAIDYLLKNFHLLIILLLLLIIWAADVGAYFAGKQFGKTKLAAKVSPGKTREGAVGGLVFSLIIAILGAKYLLDLQWDKVLLNFLIIGMCVFLSSVIGDLSVSMFKRNAKLKDSGVFLPGHGGVMDRIDSLCAGVVFYALCLHYISPFMSLT